ncbi:MAG: ornithine carbamoyltransferase [Clostridiales bacterium]
MKNFININDLTLTEINKIFEITKDIKDKLKTGVKEPVLKDKTLGMIFTKSSTRTRVSFEVGTYQLGGYPLFLSSSDIQLGRGETIEDTAKVLSRYVDCIMIRTFKHTDIEELAKYSSIPVINGLSDLLHPCQAMADLYTILEHKNKLSGLKLCFIGDGNNVANSLLHVCTKVGMDISVATPTGYECNDLIIKNSMENAKTSGSKITFTNNPTEAISNSDVVYTDTWISMGQESEKKSKIEEFKKFQINSELFSKANENAMFLHCLPAYRGYEVTADVIDGPNSFVFDEAENRLHVQKSIMALLMNKDHFTKSKK